MDFSSPDILSLIPQRSPMIMVDAVLKHDDTTITTSFLVQKSNWFVENNVLTESGLLENIAQSAASKVGLAYQQKNENVPLGFIGAISKVEVHNLPAIETTIITKVAILQEVFNFTLISGECVAGDTLLLKCQMKIVINP